MPTLDSSVRTCYTITGNVTGNVSEHCENEIAAMDARMTIKEIARLSGVGISTVSRVLNKRPDVNEETRERVMEVIRREGYEPNTLSLIHI